MSQLADDLRSARALIDTPDKLRRYRAIYDVFREVSGDLTTEDDVRFIALFRAVSEANNAATPRGVMGKPHADILALFDRAIAAAEASE